MKLEGWQKASPAELRAAGKSATSGGYVNPNGEVVSRRAYLNAQARDVGFDNYSQFQRAPERHKVYREALAASNSPETVRKLDSDFNRMYARDIRPRLDREDRMIGKGRIGAQMWRDWFEYADVDEPETFIDEISPQGE